MLCMAAPTGQTTCSDLHRVFELVLYTAASLQSHMSSICGIWSEVAHGGWDGFGDDLVDPWGRKVILRYIERLYVTGKWIQRPDLLAWMFCAGVVACVAVERISRSERLDNASQSADDRLNKPGRSQNL